MPTSAPRPVASPAPMRVLVVSESPALAAGLGAILGAEGIRAVGTRATTARLPDAVTRTGATVAVVAPVRDLTPRVRAALGAVPGVVVLLGHTALKVHGTELGRTAGCECLPLTSSPAEITGALRRATGVTPGGGGHAVTVESVAVGAAGRLTPREQQVLAALARGSTNRDIAEELAVGDETVKSHLKRVFRKLAVGSRAEAVAAYLGRGD